MWKYASNSRKICNLIDPRLWYFEGACPQFSRSGFIVHGYRYGVPIEYFSIFMLFDYLRLQSWKQKFVLISDNFTTSLLCFCGEACEMEKLLKENPKFVSNFICRHLRILETNIVVGSVTRRGTS